MTLLTAMSAAQATEFGEAIRNGGMNLRPSTAPRLTGALLDLQDGVVPSKLVVAVRGSSTTANSAVSADKKSQAWLERSIALMQQYAPQVSNAGMFGTNGVTLANLITYDPRFASIGPGIALDTTHSLAGYGIQMSAATGSLVWQPNTPYDRTDIYTTSGGATRDLGVQFGGGAVNTITTPALSFQKTTLTKTLGQEPINFTKGATSGAVIQIVDTYNTADPRIRFANLGRSGWSTVDWTVATDARSPFNSLRALNPLAIILDEGPNAWRDGVPAATMKAKLQTEIDNNIDQSDMILASPFPGSVAAYPSQVPYQMAIRELAISNNLPLIDFTRSLETWEISNPQGYYRDNTHLTAVRGNGKAARFFARAIRTLVGFD